VQNLIPLFTAVCFYPFYPHGEGYSPRLKIWVLASGSHFFFCSPGMNLPFRLQTMSHWCFCSKWAFRMIPPFFAGMIFSTPPPNFVGVGPRGGTNLFFFGPPPFTELTNSPPILPILIFCFRHPLAEFCDLLQRFPSVKHPAY